MKKSLLLVAAVLIAALIPAFAYAEPDDIAGGEYQGVDWRITAENELLIGKAGETQVFVDQVNMPPWTEGDLNEQITSVKILGTVKANVETNGLFSGLENAAAFDLRGLDTSEVYDMQGMFRQCRSVEMLDLTSFDTSNVRSMRELFSDCTSLRDVRLSSFDTENLRDAGDMFYDCVALKELDLSAFRLCFPYITNLKMLGGSTYLDEIIAPKALEHDVPLTETMYDREGTAYDTLPKGLIRSIVLYKNRDEAIASLPYEEDIAGECDGVDWEIDEDGVLILGAEGETQTFSYREHRSYDGTDGYGDTFEPYSYPWHAFRPYIKGVVFKGTVKANGAADEMFLDMKSARSIDLNGFDASGATSLWNLFRGCGSLTALDLSGLDTQNTTNMRGMFCGCKGIAPLDVSALKTGNVTTMELMFSECGNVEGLDSFDTGSVTNMSGMFSGCGMETLDLTGFDTGKVRSMHGMFEDCSMLRSVDLSSFSAAALSETDYMFYGCGSLTELDLSSLKGKLGSWDGMFKGCAGLKKLDISGLDTSGCANWPDDDGSVDYVFDRCGALRQIALGKKTTSKESLFKKNWVRYSDLNGKATGSGVFYSDLPTYTGKYPGWYKQVDRKNSPAQISRVVKRAGRRTLKRRAVTVKAIRVKNAKGGKVTYKRLSGSGRLKLLKGGKVKVRRYTKRGTYFMRVRVRVAGTAYYLPKSKIVRVKIRVR